MTDQPQAPDQAPESGNVAAPTSDKKKRNKEGASFPAAERQGWLFAKDIVKHIKDRHGQYL